MNHEAGSIRNLLN